MMRIAIVDDERRCREEAAGFVARYFAGDASRYKLSFFENGADLLERYRPVYDLVLLDIEMPLLDGVEAAKRLRALDDQVVLLYMTRMAQYAAFGYDVDAIGFLIKPIDYYSFELKLRKAERILSGRATVSLMVSGRDGKRVISSDELCYIEVSGHELALHTQRETFRAWGSLAEYERRLAGAHFAAPSRYFLANLARVRAVEEQAVLVGEERLPLSRAKRKEFMRRLTEFYGSR